MVKKGILFVDDEPNILDGLRRMLRSMRKEFTLAFADGGQKALDEVKSKNFDIVVSDMRMPGMDGAEFLTEVKKISPQTIRIMLTGQADDESVMRTIGVVHQFLAKPCDPDKLKEILIRAATLHQIMVDGKLKEVITTIDTLPSVPSVYTELQQKMMDPEVDLDEIGKIIEQDIAMTAKVLQLVNSAFFGLFQKVETPSRAVSLLGLDTIKSLVLGVKIFSDQTFPGNTTIIDNLWQHSMTVGTVAKQIALSESDDDEIGNNSFFAGILHDIGKLIFLANMADEYKRVFDIAEDEGLSQYEAEKRVFGASHCEIGAYLIGLWGFHTEVVEAIAFHHQMATFKAQEFTPALAVHAANIFVHQLSEQDESTTAPTLDHEYLKNTGFFEKVNDWKLIANEILGH